MDQVLQNDAVGPCGNVSSRAGTGGAACTGRELGGLWAVLDVRHSVCAGYAVSQRCLESIVDFFGWTKVSSGLNARRFSRQAGN